MKATLEWARCELLKVAVVLARGELLVHEEDLRNTTRSRQLAGALRNRSTLLSQDVVAVLKRLEEMAGRSAHVDEVVSALVNPEIPRQDDEGVLRLKGDAAFHETLREATQFASSRWWKWKPGMGVRNTAELATTWRVTALGGDCYAEDGSGRWANPHVKAGKTGDGFWIPDLCDVATRAWVVELIRLHNEGLR